MESEIHPLAVVHPKAQIGRGVIIEPFAVVKEHVVLHDGAVIKSHVYLDGHTTIGAHTVIWPHAVIGTKTQDKKYRGERTYVDIGPHCDIREFVTINSSTQEDSRVSIGEGSLIMASCHIAHNCEVGKRVTMSNGVLLAGHVIVEDYAILGGMLAAHQFVRIGCYAMVGGVSRVSYDVPPYTIGAGIPYQLGGINRIGLKRHQFPFSTRRALFRAYQVVYRSGLPLHAALEHLEAAGDVSPEVQHFITFCRTSQRGIIGLHRNFRPAQAAQEEPVEV